MNAQLTYIQGHRNTRAAAIVVFLVVLALIAIAVLELTAGHPPMAGPFLLPHVAAGPMA